MRKIPTAAGPESGLSQCQKNVEDRASDGAHKLCEQDESHRGCSIRKNATRIGGECGSTQKGSTVGDGHWETFRRVNNGASKVNCHAQPARRTRQVRNK